MLLKLLFLTRTMNFKCKSKTILKTNLSGHLFCKHSNAVYSEEWAGTGTTGLYCSLKTACIDTKDSKSCSFYGLWELHTCH